MKTEVIQGVNDAGAWQNAINAFETTHKVKATQTHVQAVVIGERYDILYTAVLYYEEQQPQQTASTTAKMVLKKVN